MIRYREKVPYLIHREDYMKKSSRCPVCGSLHIKVLSETGFKDKDVGENKQGGKSGEKGPWKCYDCYRQFEKPDEA